MLIFLGIIFIGMCLAPLSCIILWNRFNNFSDSIIHSCMFGGLISQLTNLDIGISILISSLIIWIISVNIKYDNNIVYLSSMFLSAIATLFGKYDHVLFGDIIFIDYYDLIIIILLGAIVNIYIYKYYRDLVLMSINLDLSINSNINVNFHRNFSLFLIIATIALSIKIIGGSFFIIGSMILPGMIGRLFSKNPYNMIINSIIIGFLINMASISFAHFYEVNFASINIIIGFIFYIALKKITTSRGGIVSI